MPSPTNMSKKAKLAKLALVAGTTIAVVSALGLGVVPSIRESYASRAILTQRVQVDSAGSSLFGDGSTAIGSPQLMIIDDPKAVVLGTDKSKVRQVDDSYLQAHKIYPLQLKTVDFTINLVRMTMMATFVFGLFVALVAKNVRAKASNPA